MERQLNFTPIDIHPQSEIESSEINNIFSDISKDLTYINDDINNTTANLGELLKSTKTKFSQIKQILNSEKERLEDINILCNKYTDFSNIIQVNDKNCEHTLDFKSNCFSLQPNDIKPIRPEIIDISGNGYEGNDYVYKNNKFLKDSNPTSNRSFITDNTINSFYEYSRITAEKQEVEIFPLVNFDSIYAKCIITLKSDHLFNILELKSEQKDLIVESIYISNDGFNYRKAGSNNIKINDREERFKNDQYIYGTGLLTFDDCKFLKLTLKSNSNTDDSIAFKKKVAYKNTEETVELKTGKRSVIKINDIKVSYNKFKTIGSLQKNITITEPTTSIALFANEYAKDSLDLRSNIKYTLTINGSDYDIIPINSNSNGKKIIRTTSSSILVEYVHYLNETIKNASLNISIKTPNINTTPYVSDVKILIGEVEK